MLILSTNIDKKKLETAFDHCFQSKSLFLVIFDPHLSIGKSVFDLRLSGLKKRGRYWFFWLWDYTQKYCFNEHPKQMFT